MNIKICLAILLVTGASIYLTAAAEARENPKVDSPVDAQGPPMPSLLAEPIALPEIEAPSEKALPVDTTQPNISCDQIQARLEAYNKMARQHDSSVSVFLADVSNKMTDWYDLLMPLEGSTEAIALGAFAPLQDGASKITAVSDLAFENSALLANEMDRIIVSLKDCLLTGPNTKP